MSEHRYRMPFLTQADMERLNTKRFDLPEPKLEFLPLPKGRADVDPVEHPPHYGGGDNPYEAIKVIEAWRLGFHLGNAVKYIARAGKKGTALVDLRKARWYIDREIRRQEGAGAARDVSLFDAWDAGFTEAVQQWTMQRDDPTHPITRTNPYKETP